MGSTSGDQISLHQQEYTTQIQDGGPAEVLPLPGSRTAWLPSGQVSSQQYN